MHYPKFMHSPQFEPSWLQYFILYLLNYFSLLHCKDYAIFIADHIETKSKRSRRAWKRLADSENSILLYCGCKGYGLVLLSKKYCFEGDVCLFVISKDNSSKASISIESKVVIKVGRGVKNINNKLKLLVSYKNSKSFHCQIAF